MVESGIEPGASVHQIRGPSAEVPNVRGRRQGSSQTRSNRMRTLLRLAAQFIAWSALRASVDLLPPEDDVNLRHQEILLASTSESSENMSRKLVGVLLIGIPLGR